MISTRLGLGALLIVSVLLCAARADAQTTDAVAVLSAGGVESVDVFDLADDATRVVRLGARRIVPDDVGPSRVSDFAILPDGAHLLADVDGRGAAVTTPSGDRFRWVLDPRQRFSDVDAVAVASYFAPGEPSQVLVGDSASSNVTIRATAQETVTWFESVRLTASRGDVVQLIAMPDNQIAFGVHWPTIDVWGIEVRDVADIMDNGHSLLSADHVEASDTATIVPEIEGMVDLMGLPDGNLLMTTRYSIVILSPEDGTVVDEFPTGEFDAVTGELSSARWLESDRIALSTFQPGEWVRPHTNHRVHWLDPQTRTIVATSEALTRAPTRLESLGGHGGTGTFGFDGGLDAIQQGDPTAVTLVRLDVSPQEVPFGDRLTTRATLQNDGEFPVGLASVVVRGSVGDCSGELQRDFAFATAESVAIGSGQAITVFGEEPVDSRIALGEWCAYVEGKDQTGTWRQYGEPTPFTVVERSSASDSTIDVRPLPFGETTDVGRDGGPDAGGDPSDGPPPQKGCCATVEDRTPNPAPWLVLLIGALIALRRPWARDRARR